MFSRQLANPANRPTVSKSDINPISLIKLGLIDPKNGVVAPSEPQMILDNSKKMTLGEKICYALIFLIFIGGIVGIIIYHSSKKVANLKTFYYRILS